MKVSRLTACLAAASAVPWLMLAGETPGSAGARSSNGGVDRILRKDYSNVLEFLGEQDAASASGPAPAAGESTAGREEIERLKASSARRERTLLALLSDLRDENRRILSGQEERERDLKQRVAELETRLAETVKALEAAESRARPPDDPPNVPGLIAESRALEKAGRLEDAEKTLRQALDERVRALGQNDPRVGLTLNDLGLLSMAAGKPDQADRIFGQALGLFKSSLGEGHPHCAATLSNMAKLRRAQKRYAEAEALYRQALGIFSASMGKTHPHVATTWSNLASLLREMKEYGESAKAFDRCLDIRLKTLGDKDPKVGETLNNIGLLCLEREQFDDCEKNLKKALEIYEKALGPADPAVAAVLGNLAACQRRAGRDEEAAETETRAQRIRGGPQ